MTGQLWDHRRYCDAAEAEIAAFGAGLGTVALDAPVPSCPGWSVADLVRHLGGVQRWAGGMVDVLAQRRMGLREIGVAFPEAPGDHLPWFTEGGQRLIATLRDADPDAGMWAWGTDQHVRFWSRRQLHETAVHRCDLDLAAGREPAVEPETALDGIEELLVGLEPAAAFSPKIENLRGDGEVIAFEAAGAGARWLFRLLPDRFEWSRDDAGGAGGADAAVRGAASDVYLFMWGRRKLDDPRLEFTGDKNLLVHWVENSAIG